MRQVQSGAQICRRVFVAVEQAVVVETCQYQTVGGADVRGIGVGHVGRQRVNAGGGRQITVDCTCVAG